VIVAETEDGPIAFAASFPYSARACYAGIGEFSVYVRRNYRGHGAGLMKDAMCRTLQAADIAGLRPVAVHAKDDAARAFYEHFGCVASTADPFHLMKDLRRIADG
jgi:L-amino acid N-acyltransferase YncA